MEKISKEIQNMEKQWFSTNHNSEEEPYILTSEEEQLAIKNAKDQKRKYHEVKYLQKGLPQKMVDEKLATMDFTVNEEWILRQANSNKQYKIWEQKQREGEKQELLEKQEAIRKTWTAGTMLKLMRWTSKEVFGKDLIENQDTLPLIKAVCLFLSEDERFEKDLGYSLKKGLMIRGVAGVGKTHTIRCVESNERNPISLYSMIEIAEQVKSDGEFLLTSKKKIYLDDVGSEEATINHYGTKINWFKDFIETHYLHQNIFNRIIVSTNCTFNELENKYGFRVRSRFKDMFNILDVDGIDMRGL
jgi:hypothetical protein